MPRFEVELRKTWEGDADDEEDAIRQAVADIDDVDCDVEELEDEEEEDDAEGKD